MIIIKALFTLAKQLKQEQQKNLYRYTQTLRKNRFLDLVLTRKCLRDL